jgi:hypothetical protein
MYLIKEPKYFDKIQNVVKISTLVVENIFKREVEVYEFERLQKVKDLINNKNKEIWYHDCIDLSAYLQLFLEVKHEMAIYKQLGENQQIFSKFVKLIKTHRNDLAHNNITKIDKEKLCENVLIIKIFLSAVIEIDEKLIKRKYYDYIEKLYLELEEIE